MTSHGGELGAQPVSLAPEPVAGTVSCAWAKPPAEMMLRDSGFYVGVQKIPAAPRWHE